MRTVTRTQVRDAISTIMEDGNTWSTDQIRTALAKKGWEYGVDYEEGQFSGSLHVLTSQKKIKRLERGIYCKTAASEKEEPYSENKFPETIAGIQERILPQIQLLYQNLCSEFNTVTLNILNSEKEIEQIKPFLLLKKELEELITDRKI